MNRIKSSAVAALVALLTMAVEAPSLCAQGDQKPVKYAVVEIGGVYEAIPADQVNDKKKALKAEHKRAVAEHKERKAAAKKAKEKFSDPAPKAEKLKVVKTGLDKETADKLIEELSAKEKPKGEGRSKGRKQNGKKKGKKGG